MAGFWGSLGTTIIVGYILGRINEDRNTGNDAGDAGDPDYGVRLQSTADPSSKRPVVYGEAFTGGSLFDLSMSEDKQRMTYALVLSEKTGLLNLGAGPASEFSFKDIYWNNSRVIFLDDGITVDYIVDRNGVVDRNLNNLVKIYCYNGSSTDGVPPQHYATTIPDAFDVMPDWTTAHTADDLVFIVIEVTYDKDKDVTGLGTIVVDLQNSMDLPGDCIHDFMTNERYGAGIPAGDIL